MNTYLRFTLLLTLLMVLTILSACSSDSKKKPSIDEPLSLTEQLQIVADDAVEAGLPGVSLHVQNNGESINVVAGVVHRDTAEPVTPSSIFHANSIGKTFTATMLLRLVDMGFLNLDDSIDQWLDPTMASMVADSDRITVEMLLAHTSGIQDYIRTEFLKAFAESPGKRWAPIEILGYIEDTQNNFEPGTQYSYSNTNYMLLGVIAERVTGLSLGMALRQWVIEPVGLGNTYGAFENLGQPETAHGYMPATVVNDTALETDPAIDTTEWLLSEGLGDASIHSSPSDLNAFIRTLIDTDTLVSGDLKTKMLTESFPGQSEHGLGIQLFEGGMFGHGGKGWGSRSEMFYIPSKDLSFATVVNGSFGYFDELYDNYFAQLSSVLGLD